MSIQIDSSALERRLEQEIAAQRSGQEGASTAKNTIGSAIGTGPASPDLPRLDHQFDLDSALDKAYQKAVIYMNNKLQPDDMQVQLEMSEDGPIGVVKEQADGKKITTYPGTQLLQAYAHNQQSRGIVVDGVS